MNVLEILELIITVVCGFLSYYFNQSAKGAQIKSQVESTFNLLQTSASQYINRAEEKYVNDFKSGDTKFNYVVDKLVNMVPENLRGTINEDEVKQLVQDAFDKMEQYAFMQIDNTINKHILKEDDSQ